MEWYEIVLLIIFTYFSITTLRMTLFIDIWYYKIASKILAIEIALYNDVEDGKITEDEYLYICRQLYPKEVFVNLWYLFLAPWVWGQKMCCRKGVYKKIDALFKTIQV